MDFNNIIKFMGQQLNALKEIEELIAHNEMQASTHSIKPEDIETLKTYVHTMKTAASTATALAKHFKKGGVAESPKTEPLTPAEPTTPIEPTESTEPAEPTIPIEPVNPTEPTEPTEPVEKTRRRRSTTKKPEVPVVDPVVEEETPEDIEFDFLM